MTTKDEVWNGREIGFRDEGGKLYLTRCPDCGLENYAMCVASGQCVWCGWNEGVGYEHLSQDKRIPEPSSDS